MVPGSSSGRHFGSALPAATESSLSRSALYTTELSSPCCRIQRVGSPRSAAIDEEAECSWVEGEDEDVEEEGDEGEPPPAFALENIIVSMVSGAPDRTARCEDAPNAEGKAGRRRE